MELKVLSNDEIAEVLHRPCCTGDYRERVEQLFMALPAPSAEEIAERLAVEKHIVEGLLSHVRRNAVEHRWTVPHVRRGKDTGVDRYFAVLVEKNGRRVMDAGTQHMIADGGRGTLSHSATMARNEAAALIATAEHVPPLAGARLRNLAEDFAYIGRKAEGIAAELVAVSEANGA